MGTYVVTGSASGIGAATHARLTADGHRVIGVDLHDADIEVDLGTVEGRQAALDSVLEATGELDGLVTCAGIGPLPDRSGALIASVNYFGSVVLLAGLRKLLAATEAPAAVAISSNSTTTMPGVPIDVVDACLAEDEPRARELAEAAGGLYAYPASKVAIARWVRRNATGTDWAGSGIRLNAVAPGMIETAMIVEGRADPMLGPALEQFPIPVGRPGRADEIADLIVYLLSPQAAYFCGSVVFCDGGTDALLRPDDWPGIWNPT